VFFGLHERQLDDKGRVALPAPYRDDLGDRCVLVFGDSRCIEVHAADAFEARAAELSDSVKRGEASITRQRALAHSATSVSVDRQGRITVEERLRDFARIPLSSKVIVTGNIDRVELWSDAVYREVADRTSAELAAS
jgi:transcriptional regulator MraZ